MSNIVVTGGAGFIGSWVAEGLADMGHEVISLDDLSGGDINNVRGDLQFYAVDCADMDKVCAYLDKPIDILIHCAANAREGASQFQPVSVTRRNYMAYMTVLTRAIQNGLKHCVLFSSMSVYGLGIPPFRESDPIAPVDIYGINKAAMEESTGILAKIHEFWYTIIRPHNVFGEYQSLCDEKRNVVAIFMNRIMRGEPIIIYGDGLQRRAFSYIVDSIPCFLEICSKEMPRKNDIVNIGGKEAITVLDLAQTVKDAMGEPDWPVVHVADRPCEVKDAWSTYDKSESEYGYRENVGWKEGVYNMAEWAKKRGPQEWVESDLLELGGSKLPVTWRNDFDPKKLSEVG